MNETDVTQVIDSTMPKTARLSPGCRCQKPIRGNDYER